MERTLVLFKPDTVKRKIIGELITRLEKKDFVITHLKMCQLEKETVESHYAHVKAESIYEDMIRFILSGPVVIMIVEGRNVIQSIRNMIGKTSSFDSPSGTIRGDYGSHRFENLIHASDAVESAELEIKRFFPEMQ